MARATWDVGTPRQPKNQVQHQHPPQKYSWMVPSKLNSEDMTSILAGHCLERDAAGSNLEKVPRATWSSWAHCMCRTQLRFFFLLHQPLTGVFSVRLLHSRSHRPTAAATPDPIRLSKSQPCVTMVRLWRILKHDQANRKPKTWKPGQRPCRVREWRYTSLRPGEHGLMVQRRYRSRKAGMGLLW